LDVCPVCSHGFKQSRGWTWVDLFGLVGGDHRVTIPQGFAGNREATPGVPAQTEECGCLHCPLCYNVKAIGKAGLLWIGEKFYKTPEEFNREGINLGLSRRISAIPRNFKVGETWVMLAHPKGDRSCDYVSPEEAEEKHLRLETENGITWQYFPAVFTLWKPSRIEKICKESERGSEAVAKLLEQGITPVFVPDDDKDHQGSVHDKEEEEEAETTWRPGLKTVA